MTKTFQMSTSGSSKRSQKAGALQDDFPVDTLAQLNAMYKRLPPMTGSFTMDLEDLNTPFKDLYANRSPEQEATVVDILPSKHNRQQAKSLAYLKRKQIAAFVPNKDGHEEDAKIDEVFEEMSKKFDHDPDY